jgi:hypothetical protein
VPLARGLRPPGPPNFPPSWAKGSPTFWVPLVGGVPGVGNSPPILKLWGDTPRAPRQGASPPGPPNFPPSWAKGSPAFWVPPVAGSLMWLRFLRAHSPHLQRLRSESNLPLGGGVGKIKGGGRAKRGAGGALYPQSAIAGPNSPLEGLGWETGRTGKR